jgi:hypothetical protein
MSASMAEEEDPLAAPEDQAPAAVVAGLTLAVFLLLAAAAFWGG